MARRIDDASDCLAYYTHKEPSISMTLGISNISIPTIIKCPTIEIPDLYKQCCLGIWEDKKEERYNMERNKVLDLYVKKNRENIEKKYHEIVEKEYNELPEVKEYNDLINTFATSLEELAHRYNDHFELNTKFFTQTGYLNQFAWEINPLLKDGIKKKYQKDFENEMYKLDDFANTIQAVLSISEDKDYQIEVLKNYDILDKKGKLNI